MQLVHPKSLWNRRIYTVTPKCLGVLLALVLLFSAVPVFAHHSFAAEYDVKQPVTLRGVVTKVEWLNPHIYLYVDVKDASGNTVNWSVEGGPPNSLYRLGWRKDTLKPGDGVTIDAFRAKDGTSTANARNVLLPDGRKVFAGSADDGGPKATPTK
jgi:hypothetical protein